MSLQNPENFESPEFLGELVPKLVKHFHQLTGDEMFAEDLVQEAVLVALQKWRNGQMVALTAGPAAYLFGITRGLYLRESRRTLRQQTYPHAELPEVAGEARSESVLLATQYLKLCQRVIASMSSPRDRELLVRVLEQADKPDLCAEFDLSPRHFDRVLHRAIKRATALGAQCPQVALAN